jgi:hypothetical protein
VAGFGVVEVEAVGGVVLALTLAVEDVLPEGCWSRWSVVIRAAIPACSRAAWVLAIWTAFDCTTCAVTTWPTSCASGLSPRAVLSVAGDPATPVVGVPEGGGLLICMNCGVLDVVGPYGPRSEARWPWRFVYNPAHGGPFTQYR